MVPISSLGLCVVLQLVVVMCTAAVLFSMITAVYITMLFISTTPRRGGLRFGTARLIRAEHAVPRGRSLRFQAVKGGRGARIDTLTSWRPRRGKKMKPIHSDSLQVQVKPVVSESQRRQNDLDFGGHVARFFFTDFHEKKSARGARSMLGFSIYLTLAQTDQVRLILAFAHNKILRKYMFIVPFRRGKNFHRSAPPPKS